MCVFEGTQHINGIETLDSTDVKKFTVKKWTKEE